MQQRDYLKDQIEQLGKVLAQLFAKVVGYEGEALSPSVSDELQQVFSEELDFDLEKALELDGSAFKQELLDGRWHDTHLESFAKTLLALSKTDTSTTNRRNHLEKALIVMEVIEVQSRSISFQQMALTDVIRKALESQ